MNRKKFLSANIFLLVFIQVLLSWYPLMAVSQENQKTEIMFVGFAHLNQLMNGTPEADIFSIKKQDEINNLTEDLKKFRPDMVMVELEPGEQQWSDSLYRLYRKGELDMKNFKYGAGETFQVGFRLGKKLGLERIHGIDYDASTSQSLLNKGENIEMFFSELKRLQTTARPLNQQVQKDSLSIYEFIRKMNEPEIVDLTHHLFFNIPAYVMNGDFDTKLLNEHVDMEKIDKEYIGAEFISLFYNRNLKIYSNILRAHRKNNGQRLMVIIGQAHVGVLQDLFEENPNFRIISPLKFLEEHEEKSITKITKPK